MGEEDAHMAPTATELQMFSHLLPGTAQKRTPSMPEASPGSEVAAPETKCPRTEGGKTKPPKGSRKGPDKGKGPIPREESSAGSQRQLALLQQTVNMLGRLVLRHEDAHAIQRTNSDYVLLLRSGQATESMPGPLYQASQLWKKQKELGKATSPLRVILWALLLEELGSRASLLLQNSQAMQSAIQGGLIEREGDQTSWNYLAWDAQAKREIKDTTIAPMTHDRLLRRIKTLQEDAKGDIILRFHGVRPLTEDLQGEIYTMLLEVGTNGEREQNVHTFLRDLCNLSVWRLLAGRFRRDRLQRTPLANRISECIQ